MTRLPQISGRELVRVLEKLGYRNARQKGSHMRLLHRDRKPLSVPDHKIIGKGLLHKILRDAGIDADQLRQLLD
jgi:predicted RNA binding protein YcfA (HicA-like mRNA interferase family)